VTVDGNQHALTGAYALDALDPAERAEFEAHLATCAECREEVAGLRETAARVAATTWVDAPAALRGRVLAEAALTPQVAPAAPAATAEGPAAGLRSVPDGGPAAGLRSVPGGGTTPGGRSTAATLRPAAWRRWWAAAAAVLVLVVGGAVGGAFAVHQRQAHQEAAAAQAHMMLIATAPDAVSHDVAFGTSHLVMSAQMSAGALVGEDVPMPGHTGMTYQLWMVHADGSMAPGPTFMPDRGRVLAFVEGDLAAVTALTVTEEPMGGSSVPTGHVVALVSL
jgi:anti-sigma factor RsiW